MFGFLGGKKRRGDKARRLELEGDLEAAARLYLEAELGDEAARVLLSRADAARDPAERMALCARAVRAGGDGEHARAARRRRAVLAFDLLAGGGATLKGELAAAAAELEACGEWQKAARAYALAGDAAGEIRVLRDAGAIAELEQRLDAEAESGKLERARSALLARLDDLDRVAERRQALREGAAWLEQHADEGVAERLRAVRARLLVGPAVALETEGVRVRCALGAEVTIGRARSEIVVEADGVSRQHLRLFRRAGAPWLEDLGTRNGTTLGGARVSAPLPVGPGVELRLAEQVPVRLRPLVADDPGCPLEAEVAGERWLVPLGPLAFPWHPLAPARPPRPSAGGAPWRGGWEIADAHDGAERFVVLRTLAGREPPYLKGLRLGPQIELGLGDALTAERDGPVVLSVPPQDAPP
ncbi:MAG: FHA domain-containing protein [Polyangiaceae bacterium]|nr:FHA domain-containing protein [Polyangiaceae bacterium]